MSVLKIGSASYANVKLGSTQVQKVYRGTTLMWSGGAPPVDDSVLSASLTYTQTQYPSGSFWSSGSFSGALLKISPTEWLGTFSGIDNGVVYSQYPVRIYLASAGCYKFIWGYGNPLSAVSACASSPEGPFTFDNIYTADGSQYRFAGTATVAIAHPCSDTPPATTTNWALTSEHAVATADSTYYLTNNYGAFRAVDGNTSGHDSHIWESDGNCWWNPADATPPHNIVVEFECVKTIRHINVYTIKDNYTDPTPPDATTTFSQYGITAGKLEYWNGSAWIEIASYSGNNHCLKEFADLCFTTCKVRFTGLAAPDGYIRLAELECWDGVPAVVTPWIPTGTVGEIACYGGYVYDFYPDMSNEWGYYYANRDSGGSPYYIVWHTDVLYWTSGMGENLPDPQPAQCPS